MYKKSDLQLFTNKTFGEQNQYIFRISWEKINVGVEVDSFETFLRK